MNPDLLQAKRQNALAAVERLLRVTRTHESGAWVQHYEGIQGALEGGRDWDAIAREQRLGAPTARWAIAERLATDVYMAVKGLRFYIVYQVDEPLVPVGGDDPQIVERLPEQLLEYITAVVDGREPVTGWVRWLRGHWEELESIVEKQWPMEKYFTTLRGLSKYLARQGVPHRSGGLRVRGTRPNGVGAEAPGVRTDGHEAEGPGGASGGGRWGASQIRTVPPRSAVVRRLPSALKATAVSAPLCPLRVSVS